MVNAKTRLDVEDGQGRPADQQQRRDDRRAAGQTQGAPGADRADGGQAAALAQGGLDFPPDAGGQFRGRLDRGFSQQGLERGQVFFWQGGAGW
jgi:hypothetical protein